MNNDVNEKIKDNKVIREVLILILVLNVIDSMNNSKLKIKSKQIFWIDFFETIINNLLTQ